MLSTSLNITVIGWIAAVVVFLIVEAVTTGLASIWFALGAVAGLICALVGAPIWLQLLWFFAISIAALVLTRPLVKKYVNGKRKATNADSSVGKTAVVTEPIDNLAGTGAVKLDGKIWTARSVNGETFPPDTHVIVRDIQGVKLMVEKADQL